MSLILVKIDSLLKRKCIFLGYLVLKNVTVVLLMNFVAILLVLCYLFWVNPPHLASVCHLISSPIVRREVSFPSPTLHVPLSSPPPRPLASQTNLPLHVYQQSQDRYVVSYSPYATSTSFFVRGSCFIHLSSKKRWFVYYFTTMMSQKPKESIHDALLIEQKLNC